MGRLFRRVARSARSRASAKRGSASVVRDASGKRYKVTAVDDVEESKYADPPRKWGRVGVLAGGWAIVLALGAWVAPGIAASGNEENQDPRDQPATDAEGAALRYLRYGSTQDLERAASALCEDASPELTPEDLDEIRQSYAAELGGVTDVDLEVGDPVPTSDGIALAGTVYYIAEGSQRSEYFLVTVQESDGTYCVSDAVRPEEEEPSSSGTSGPTIDPQELATEFMRAIVVDRSPQTAAADQCDTFEGITPEELHAAIDEWASTNGDTTAFLNGIEPSDASEGSTTAFAAEVSLRGEVIQEDFTFQVGVQGDCVASLEGGDELMGAASD